MCHIPNEGRSLRLAVVQVASQPGQITVNHAHALPFIERAVEQRAQLVILPELFTCGYVPNQSIWQYGETLAGPTVTWLRATSKRLGIYLGAGWLEIDGTDFFNSFALAGPNGELDGCARKTRAETYCFRYGAGRHVIDTDIARLGVGICADNHHSLFHQLMQRSDIDLLLMPHASPMPYKITKVISEADIDRARENTISIPSLYARTLGIPTVFANAVGNLQPMTGLLGKFITPETFRLRGLSRIVDWDGTLRGELAEEEGVLVAEVTLAPSHKRNIPPPDYDGWLHRGSTMTRKLLLPIDAALGRVAYSLSRNRRRMARSGAGEPLSSR